MENDEQVELYQVKILFPIFSLILAFLSDRPADVAADIDTWLAKFQPLVVIVLFSQSVILILFPICYPLCSAHTLLHCL